MCVNPYLNTIVFTLHFVTVLLHVGKYIQGQLKEDPKVFFEMWQNYIAEIIHNCTLKSNQNTCLNIKSMYKPFLSVKTKRQMQYHMTKMMLFLKILLLHSIIFKVFNIFYLSDIIYFVWCIHRITPLLCFKFYLFYLW